MWVFIPGLGLFGFGEGGEVKRGFGLGQSLANISFVAVRLSSHILSLVVNSFHLVRGGKKVLRRNFTCGHHLLKTSTEFIPITLFLILSPNWSKGKVG